jgi:predicted nuclease with TOPRIM domain
MTKHEKLEKAKSNHKYAIERIEELERELTKLRWTAKDRLNELQKLDPARFGELKKGRVDSYHAWRVSMGG